MRKLSWLTLLGVLVFLLEFIFLRNSGLFYPGFDYDNQVIAAGLILGGLVFFFELLKDKNRHWWAAFPGSLLIGLGILLLLIRAKGMLGEHMVMVFLCSIGFPFLIIALIKPSAWWMLIPGGFFFSSGLLFSLSTFDGFYIDLPSFIGQLFLGFTATFMAVALYPRQPGKKFVWAWFLAFFFAILGGMIWLNELKLI